MDEWIEEHPGEFWKQKWLMLEGASLAGGLSTLEYRLLQRILAYYNPHFGYAWPGQELLAEELGVDVRSVRRSTRKLEDKGWITTRKSFRRGIANEYVPNFDRISSKALRSDNI